MARVFIGVGHGGSDPGAVGYVVEKDATLTVALAAKEELERNGVTVGISRTKDEDVGITKECRMANDFHPDVAIEVHFNAGGGYGFEAFVQTNKYESRSRSLARSIESHVEAIGQYSRGLKTKQGSNGDYFAWNRTVNCPAIILEGFFVDTSDAYDFDTVAEQRELGKAYAHGVMAYLNISVSPEKKYTEKIRGVYKVKANGGLNLRSSASTSAPVAETMGNGSYAICYGYYSGDWYYVQSQDGKTGFCNKDYLEKVMPFVDVPFDSYYFKPVEWAVKRGITSGASNNKFKPNDRLTRSQAVTMLFASFGKPEPKTYEPFSDVRPADYYSKPAQWARENRIASGIGNNKFGGNQPCTRSQAVTMLWRAFGSPVVDCKLPFGDVKESDYFYNAVKWAYKTGITSGVSERMFAPNEPCTRAQMVCFLYKLNT